MERDGVIARANEVARRLEAVASDLHTWNKKDTDLTFSRDPDSARYVLERRGSDGSSSTGSVLDIGQYWKVESTYGAPRPENTTRTIAQDLVRKANEIRREAQWAKDKPLDEIYSRFSRVPIENPTIVWTPSYDLSRTTQSPSLFSSVHPASPEAVDLFTYGLGAKPVDRLTQKRSVGALSIRTDGGLALAACTVTLVAPDRVISSAHCFCGTYLSKGSCQSAGIINPEGAVKHVGNRHRLFFQHYGWLDIVKAEIPPNYNWPMADIAVVTLAQRVENAEIEPMELNAHPDSEVASIMGFGRTNPFGPQGITPSLIAGNNSGLKVSASSIVGKCRDPLPQKLMHTPVNHLICRHLSANSVGQGSTCHGDSGGPHFGSYKGVWKYRGIIAGGGACEGNQDAYDIALSAYRDWIASKIPIPDPAVSAAGLIRPAVFVQETGWDKGVDWIESNQPKRLGFDVAKSRRLVVSANTTVDAQNETGFTMELTVFKGGVLQCKTSPQPAFAVSCSVDNPDPGDDWSVSYSVSHAPRAVQVVATDY